MVWTLGSSNVVLMSLCDVGVDRCLIHEQDVDRQWTMDKFAMSIANPAIFGLIMKIWFFGLLFFSRTYRHHRNHRYCFALRFSMLCLTYKPNFKPKWTKHPGSLIGDRNISCKLSIHKICARLQPFWKSQLHTHHSWSTNFNGKSIKLKWKIVNWMWVLVLLVSKPRKINDETVTKQP